MPLCGTRLSSFVYNAQNFRIEIIVRIYLNHQIDDPGEPETQNVTMAIILQW